MALRLNSSESICNYFYIILIAFNKTDELDFITQLRPLERNNKKIPESFVFILENVISNQIGNILILIQFVQRVAHLQFH